MTQTVTISSAKLVLDLMWPDVHHAMANVQDPKWNEIKGALKRVYADLRMKCLNPSCDKGLTPSDYKYHDENCSITFEICKDCGFKTRRGPNNDHSCIQVLKAELMKTRGRNRRATNCK